MIKKYDYYISKIQHSKYKYTLINNYDNIFYIPKDFMFN